MEGLLGEFLEAFLSAKQAQFDRLTPVFKSNNDPAQDRQATLDMFHLEGNRPRVLWVILAPTLRESVKKAAQSMAWPDVPEPALRLKKISDLEQKIKAVTDEMDELQGMAHATGVALAV